MAPKQDSKPARRRGTRGAPDGYATGKATRLRLIEAAEALFADRGIDAVSLNEVRLAAGQSNAAAIHYYFGSKEQLLKGILDHRVGLIEAERAELLGSMAEDDRVPDLRSILAALVRPQVHSIERGERYVGMLAHLLSAENGSYSEHASLLADPALTPSGQRVHALLRSRLEHLPPAVAERRLAFLYASALQALARHQRQKAAGAAPATTLYVSELIDALVAIITAPASPETLAELQDGAPGPQPR